MTTAEDQPLSAEDQHEVLRVARAAGADLSAAVPRVLRSPTESDVSLARAAHDLRPAALPWSSLSDAMRQNLAIGVIPLRLALIAEGWVPPGRPAPRIAQPGERRCWMPITDAPTAGGVARRCIAPFSHKGDHVPEPAAAAAVRCPARIWPAWASSWVICASEIVRGRCVRYGHPVGAATTERPSMAELVERSSLGTPEAKAARARVSDEQVAVVLAEAKALGVLRTALDASTTDDRCDDVWLLDLARRVRAVAHVEADAIEPTTGREVFALREAAAQARWNIDHVEGDSSLDYRRHWRGTAVWLEKRAAAIERGETPDRGWRPDVAEAGAPAEPTSDTARLDAIDRLLKWGDAVGGEIGGRWDVIQCRKAVAQDLLLLGVTDAEMSAAVRRGFRQEHARRSGGLDAAPTTAPEATS